MKSNNYNQNHINNNLPAQEQQLLAADLVPKSLGQPKIFYKRALLKITESKKLTVETLVAIFHIDSQRIMNFMYD